MSAAERMPAETVEQLADALRTFLKEQMPDVHELRLEDLERTSVGQSRENWIFRALWRSNGVLKEMPLILRRDPLGSLLETDRSVEFAILKALEGTTLPLPRVHFLDREGARFGRPSLIMSRVEGVCEWDVLNGNSPLETRLDMARRFIAALASIHAVDWNKLRFNQFMEDPGPSAGLVELSRWGTALDGVQLEPQPELDFVRKWLVAQHRPTSETVLVHGDFKPGNALLQDGHIVAMLDWETAHLGDPMEDLGWVLNPIRAGEHQIPGYWGHNEIVAAYESLSGRSMDPEVLHWWIVFANWKLAVMLLTGLKAFVDGRLDRIHQSPTWIFKAMLKMIR